MHEAKGAVVPPEEQVYFFGEGGSEGDPESRDILGGKGASLAAMSRAGLPIPPGFTIAIPCCRHYHEHGRRWPSRLAENVTASLKRLEQASGKTFGGKTDPLLVSVRSGAAVSMPGMMDTILNCGLHPDMADALPDRELFWSVYAGFILQFGEVVAKIPSEAFEEAEKAAAANGGGKKALAERYIELYENESGKVFPTTPREALDQCINAVFDSWNNERAEVYRKAHRLTHLDGTAVTVQQMFDSEVSGIAFTANPVNPAANEIIIESAFGLGESIVSGGVTPDRFVLDKATLAVKERTLGRKDRVMSGLAGTTRPFDPLGPTLTDAEVRELGELALKVEQYFGLAVDIEWGLARGKLVLLQSRPIRGLQAAQALEEARQEEIARIKELAAGERKVWIIHNLAETLPAPTPLTWDIMREFMSGDGGFGSMYKDFGYRPTREVCEKGFLALLFGRIYADPDRVAGLFWSNFPMCYDHEEALANPAILQAAPTKFDANRVDQTFLLRLPATVVGMIRSSRLMKRARADAVRSFTEKALPGYQAYLEEKRGQDLSRMSTPDLCAEIRERMRRVLTEFGNESLKPGFFGGLALASLEQLLTQILGPADGPKLCQALTSGLEGDSSVEQMIMLHQVRKRTATMAEFLGQYGHRAVGEMELANPRFREDTAYLEQVTQAGVEDERRSPEAMHRAGREKREATMRGLRAVLAEAGGASLLEDVEGLAVEAQTLLPYRETGKHYLMMGYELIRAAIVELGRRWRIGDGVFYLRLDELPEFEQNAEQLKKEIGARRERYEMFRKLDLPDLVNSDDIHHLGLKREFKASKELPGVSLSAGAVRGTARIVFSPSEARDLGDDAILVCPSTDPSWTALFTQIQGLIVERGGVLSHGAITARDFGIPAVAFADATSIIRNGTRLQVDGDSGLIRILEDDHV